MDAKPKISVYHSGMNIYNLEHRVVSATAKVKSEPGLPEEDKEAILEYAKKLQSQNLNGGRVAKYIFTVLVIRRHLKCNFRNAGREEIEELMRWLNSTDYSAVYKNDIRQILKHFYRWLRTGALDKSIPYPPEVAWVKANLKKNELKEPDVLTEDEAMAIIRSADKPRDKAFIAVLYEGGFRIGEILSTRVGDVEFDENGARLKVHGKTGSRTVRLITSVPLLARWLEEHPYRNDPNAPLFASLVRSNKGTMAMGYAHAVKMLKETAAKAGIKKRIYPHLFRHSSATRDARYLTESELKLKYGWSGGSQMAQVYVHLSGADLDNKLLAVYAGRPIETIKPKFAPIICAKCGAENTPGQRYCGRCGAPLSAQELAKGTVEVEELKHEINELKDMLKAAFQASQVKR